MSNATKTKEKKGLTEKEMMERMYYKTRFFTTDEIKKLAKVKIVRKGVTFPWEKHSYTPDASRCILFQEMCIVVSPSKIVSNCWKVKVSIKELNSNKNNKSNATKQGGNNAEAEKKNNKKTRNNASKKTAGKTARKKK